MWKQRTRTCPECNQEFPNREQVAVHVVMVHLSQVEVPRCWCGQILLGPWSRWGTWPRSLAIARQQAEILLAHCDRHGGMQTHYTACLLGID